MKDELKAVILRHKRENLKKCSLTGLEERTDMAFYSYPKQHLPHYCDFVLLSMDAPVLEGNEKGIYLIDGTWKLAEKMEKTLPFTPQRRSLPPFKTAYPRKNTACSDETRGLASIEALFIAYLILGWDVTGLLDQYRFKETFLEKNSSLIFNG
jgi:pre-rRNA-processing protein TSR3